MVLVVDNRGVGVCFDVSGGEEIQLFRRAFEELEGFELPG